MHQPQNIGPVEKPMRAEVVDGEVVVLAVDGPPAFSMTPEAAHGTAAAIEAAATKADSAG